ncbi:hypothetical protein [Fodinicola acaciae]|uniref:hypothetical protein n=1 Tax=Fodinicola acaciae TaxID=2681555 RepID=UPI0013D5F554|nr:hypothetical protein [Fodinicola acaciae]
MDATDVEVSAWAMIKDRTSIECHVYPRSDEIEIRLGGLDGFDLIATSGGLRRLVDEAVAALREYDDAFVD